MTDQTKLTHKDLVSIAGRWLLKSNGCGVVITDMTSGAGETPDAIGWSGWDSILVECKASRSDFLIDKGKHFRRNPHRAMGTTRFFMAPHDLLKADEMADGWGLLGVKGGRVFILKESDRRQIPQTTREYEISLLTSALRRMVCVPGVRGVNCKTYVVEGSGNPRAEVLVSPDTNFSHALSAVTP